MINMTRHFILTHEHQYHINLFVRWSLISQLERQETAMTDTYAVSRK